MTPGKYDLTMYQGTTFGPYTFTFKDAAGVVVDVTGWRVFAEARGIHGVYSLSPEIVAGGLVQIAKTDEETKVPRPGMYGWDFLLEDLAGVRVGPVLQGSFNVIPINTRPA